MSLQIDELNIFIAFLSFHCYTKGVITLQGARSVGSVNCWVVLRLHYIIERVNFIGDLVKAIKAKFFILQIIFYYRGFVLLAGI